MGVTVNLSGVRSKLSPSAQRNGRRALANQAAADMNPFIPMDEGNLRQAQSIDVDGGGIAYHQKYAARLFYMYMHNYTTPGTGPRWDMKAKGLHMNDWTNAFIKGADW
ncbi:minor capsid protein [Cytobacillus horneckiae]|uniref:Capsid protein n=1 Tax=Cytobacillus horneckiae TaxID=549687 RepID=A0A2N0ZMX4_9BACI|nr:minor capsid protein [Cytobacillus horneckiae]PKG30855.1 capsid protein [Cytobacillus horneckiae]